MKEKTTRQILEERYRIILSDRDFDRLVEMLNKPDEPSPALRAAMRDYLESKD